MPNDPIEAGIGTLNRVRQTAKGAAPDFTSVAAGNADRPKWDDGALDFNKVLGQAAYIDGQAFDSATTYTKEVNGEVGNVVIQAQPENNGIYLADILCSDVVTGIADPWTHTITSGNGAQRYTAWGQVVSQNISPQRHAFWDAQTKSLTASSSHDEQELTFDMAILALKSKTLAATPTKTENTSDPYFHSEQTGQISIDGTVIGEIHESVLTIDRQQEVYWGDSHEPAQIVQKRAIITHSVKSIAGSDTLAKRNKVIFGTATPAADAAPVKDVFYASITRKYVRSATRSLEIQTPRVAIEAGDLKVGATKEGGTQEMTFGGRALKSGATPNLTAIVLSGDSAAYYA